MDELYYKKKYQKYKMKYILYSKMNANNKLEGGYLKSFFKTTSLDLVKKDGMKLKDIPTTKLCRF